MVHTKWINNIVWVSDPFQLMLGSEQNQNYGGKLLKFFKFITKGHSGNN